MHKCFPSATRLIVRPLCVHKDLAILTLGHQISRHKCAGEVMPRVVAFVEVKFRVT